MFSLKRNSFFGDLKICLRLSKGAKVQTKNTCMSVKRNVLKQLYCVYSSIRAKVRTQGGDVFKLRPTRHAVAEMSIRLHLTIGTLLNVFLNRSRRSIPKRHITVFRRQRRKLEFTMGGLGFTDSESENLRSAFTPYVKTGQSYKYTER